MQLKTIQTKLETSSIDEVVAILDRKVEEIGANGTADYVYRAINNIDSGLSRIKEAIAELKSIEKDMKEQKEIIKTGTSRWLSSNGVTKLQGDIVSSLTVSEKTSSCELIITNEESLINAGYFKMSVDETAAKNALLNDVKLEGAYLNVTHNEDTIKINKRKQK